MHQIGRIDAYKDKKGQAVVCCRMSLSVLPAGGIPQGVAHINIILSDDYPSNTALEQLILYNERQQTIKRSMGSQKLIVPDNVMESFHSDLRRHVRHTSESVLTSSASDY